MNTNTNTFVQQGVSESFRAASDRPVALISGLEGYLSEVTAIQKQMKDFMDRQLISADMQESIARESRKEFKEAIEEQTHSLSRLVQSILPAQGATSRPSMDLAIPETPSGRTVAEAATSRGGVSYPGGTPQAPEVDYDAWGEYTKRRDYIKAPGGKVSLENLRRDVGSRLGERLQSKDWGPQYTQDAGGRWRDAKGRFASADDVLDFRQRESWQMAKQGFAKTLSEGGSIRQAGASALGRTAMGSSLLKGAGVLGAVAYGVNALFNFAENQRAENAEWQRITGGSNLEGFGERGAQAGFRWSQKGVMGADMANELYKSVARTGLRGDRRQEALEFASRNYRDLGMTSANSMKMINIFAETGMESLDGFAKSLRTVSDQAKEAGRNVEEAQKRYIEMTEGLTGLIGGEAGQAMAGAVTAELEGMGPEFKDVKWSPDANVSRTLAFQMGIPYDEYVRRAREDPNFPRQNAEAFQNLVRQRLALAGNDPASQKAVLQSLGITGTTDFNANLLGEGVMSADFVQHIIKGEAEAEGRGTLPEHLKGKTVEELQGIYDSGYAPRDLKEMLAQSGLVDIGEQKGYSGGGRYMPKMPEGGWNNAPWMQGSQQVDVNINLTHTPTRGIETIVNTQADITYTTQGQQADPHSPSRPTGN